LDLMLLGGEKIVTIQRCFVLCSEKHGFKSCK